MNKTQKKKIVFGIICMVLVLVIGMGCFLWNFLTSPYNKTDAQNETIWLCLGDSITYGETNHEISYADYTGKLTGVQLVKEGFSGYTTEQLYNELDNIEADPDIVTVLIGTNDWVYDREMGKVSDQDMSTFCGSMNLLMQKITQKYPKAEVIFFTPLYRDMQYNPAIPFTGTINSNGKTVKDFGDSLKACAQRNDVKVYDLYSESGINATNINRLTNDGTHPNARGQMKIAWKVKKLVEMSKKVDGK